MRIYSIVAMVLAGGLGGLTIHLLKDPEGLSPDQKREVQDAMYRFIKENNDVPALIATALRTYAQQQEEVQTKEMQGRMNAERERLLDSNTAIVLGNPEAKTKLIVFYDNNCSHCRTTDLQLQKLLEKNKDIAVVYRQYPILGKRSEEVAAGVLAIAKYNKFSEINHIIAKSDKPLTLDLLLEMAQTVGVTAQQIKDNMASAENQAILKENLALGGKIGFQMTPTVILITESDIKLVQEVDEDSLAKILPAKTIA